MIGRERRRASFASRFLARVPVPLMGNPFELFVAVLCLLDGVPILAGKLTPGTIDALVPAWLARVWAFELVVGGLLVSLGILRRSRPIERAGLIQLGPAALAYAIASTLILGPHAAAAALVGFSGACFARASVLAAADRMRAELVEVARTFDVFPPEPEP